MMLYIVRHTEPEGGHNWTILGHKDVPLSVAGQHHAEELARHLEQVPLEAVYCSDLARAWRLAELVAQPKGLHLYRLAALREMDCGRLDGMERAQAREQYPEIFEGLRRDPVNYRIPQGETLQEVAGRVGPVIRDIRNGDSRCVLVVAHAVVNRIVICEALNLPLEYAYRIEQSYGGVTVIEYGGRHPVVYALNSPSVPLAFGGNWPRG